MLPPFATVTARAAMSIKWARRDNMRAYLIGFLSAFFPWRACLGGSNPFTAIALSMCLQRQYP